MCLAIPGKVKKIDGRKALVEYPEQIRPAMMGEDGVKIGDYVVVQMGIIIKVISSNEAKVMLRGLN